MPQISAVFAAFQHGEIRFKTLDAVVEKIVAESPERVAAVQAALQAAKDDWLPWHGYAVLWGNPWISSANDLVRVSTRAAAHPVRLLTMSPWRTRPSSSVVVIRI